MPAGASVSIPLPNGTNTSQILAQAGVTQLPGDATGVKIPTISALAGWEFDEVSGSNVRFRLYDGTSASGILIADLTISASSQSQPPPPNPIQVTSGAIYLQWVSGAGSIAGPIYILL